MADSSEGDGNDSDGTGTKPPPIPIKIEHDDVFNDRPPSDFEFRRRGSGNR